MGLRGKKASLNEKEVGQVLGRNIQRGPGGMERGLLISCLSALVELLLEEEGKESPRKESRGRKVGSMAGAQQ